MVGCFQYFFVERGLLAESALTIWLHGTLEISSIILAGGAGLTLGTGLIFPGTYSRLQAFQLSAMRSLKLMLGISPIFVVAGIIESFLTRYTDVPDILRLFLIVLSATFIIGYFVVFPWLKSRRGFDAPLVRSKTTARHAGNAQLRPRKKQRRDPQRRIPLLQTQRQPCIDMGVLDNRGHDHGRLRYEPDPRNTL